MNKVAVKKQLIIERIADHLLAEGLNKTGLRLLAQVAGTSDRMLIYYFGSKEALLNEVLGTIVANVTVQLDALLGTQPRPAGELLAQLTSLTMSESFTPAVQLWFELVGLAARGEEPYLSNAQILANNWIAWITAAARRLYAARSGRLVCPPRGPANAEANQRLNKNVTKLGASLNLTEPAILFGAISLLLLAYTNRFLALASLVRTLNHSEDEIGLQQQIANLRQRIALIKYMQAFGTLSFLLCTLATFAIFLHEVRVGEVLFGVSVVALLISLALSLYEIVISTEALNIVLDGIEDE